MEQGNNVLVVDILIVGGGIAGLWALAEWRSRGYEAILVTDELGKGQTIASQGIIHGGTKYALTGQVSQATLAIGDMPALWRKALKGEGAVDLSQAQVLTEHQLLWTSGGIGSRLTGFFASHAMKSRMVALDKGHYPDLFQTAQFKGALYQLDEPVLDIPSVLASFQQNYADYLIAVDSSESSLIEEQGQYHYLAALAQCGKVLIQAQHIIVTAGAGNGALLRPLLPKNETVQQLRPLQMVLAKGDLPRIYAHALGMSDKPRITITSHLSHDGQVVWYMGGQPAELGVGKAPKQLIQETQQELQSLLPWLDLNHLHWGTWNVDRAEAAQVGGARPDKPSLRTVANVTVAWSTKLAFAPMLAQELVQRLEPTLKPHSSAFVKTVSMATPASAKPIWEQVF
ncbi:FAD-dependent oxidoreductase [Thiofilum flexile]|uniref:FAD-dependent oxidoreductase n=1 Tax=Thiofilum flexile TaxID=125627 RepID=UPI00035CDD1D|nr:FAD-dependent oxidoreductase [Thiofilum flexile]